MRTLTLLAALFAAEAALAQCTNATLTCPATIAAVLSADDCASYDGSRYDLLQFSGTAGTTLTIQLRSSGFDTFLGLIDPAGVPIADNDDVSPGSTDSKIMHTLGASGTWTIVANSVQPAVVGDYELVVSGCAAPGPRRRSVRH